MEAIFDGKNNMKANENAAIALDNDINGFDSKGEYTVDGALNSFDDLNVANLTGDDNEDDSETSFSDSSENIELDLADVLDSCSLLDGEIINEKGCSFSDVDSFEEWGPFDSSFESDDDVGFPITTSFCRIITPKDVFPATNKSPPKSSHFRNNNLWRSAHPCRSVIEEKLLQDSDIMLDLYKQLCDKTGKTEIELKTASSCDLSLKSQEGNASKEKNEVQDSIKCKRPLLYKKKNYAKEQTQNIPLGFSDIPISSNQLKKQQTPSKSEKVSSSFDKNVTNLSSLPDKCTFLSNERLSPNNEKSTFDERMSSFSFVKGNSLRSSFARYFGSNEMKKRFSLRKPSRSKSLYDKEYQLNSKDHPKFTKKLSNAKENRDKIKKASKEKVIQISQNPKLSTKSKLTQSKVKPAKEITLDLEMYTDSPAIKEQLNNSSSQTVSSIDCLKNKSNRHLRRSESSDHTLNQFAVDKSGLSLRLCQEASTLCDGALQQYNRVLEDNNDNNQKKGKKLFESCETAEKEKVALLGNKINSARNKPNVTSNDKVNQEKYHDNPSHLKENLVPNKTKLDNHDKSEPLHDKIEQKHKCSIRKIDEMAQDHYESNQAIEKTNPVRSKDSTTDDGIIKSKCDVADLTRSNLDHDRSINEQRSTESLSKVHLTFTSSSTSSIEIITADEKPKDNARDTGFESEASSDFNSTSFNKKCDKANSEVRIEPVAKDFSDFIVKDNDTKFRITCQDTKQELVHSIKNDQHSYVKAIQDGNHGFHNVNLPVSSPRKIENSSPLLDAYDDALLAKLLTAPNKTLLNKTTNSTLHEKKVHKISRKPINEHVSPPQVHSSANSDHPEFNSSLEAFNSATLERRGRPSFRKPSKDIHGNSPENMYHLSKKQSNEPKTPALPHPLDPFQRPALHRPLLHNPVSENTYYSNSLIRPLGQRLGMPFQTQYMQQFSDSSAMSPLCSPSMYEHLRRFPLPRPRFESLAVLPQQLQSSYSSTPMISSNMDSGRPPPMRQRFSKILPRIESPGSYDMFSQRSENEDQSSLRDWLEEIDESCNQLIADCDDFDLQKESPDFDVYHDSIKRRNHNMHSNFLKIHFNEEETRSGPSKRLRNSRKFLNDKPDAFDSSRRRRSTKEFQLRNSFNFEEDHDSYATFMANFSREIRDPRLCLREQNFRCQVMSEMQRLIPIVQWSDLVRFYDTVMDYYYHISTMYMTAEEKDQESRRFLESKVEEILSSTDYAVGQIHSNVLLQMK